MARVQRLHNLHRTKKTEPHPRWDRVHAVSGQKQKTLALELFVELASGAGDVHAARHAAFPILNTLHNAGRLGALGTIRALGGIHFLFTVARFRNLCHGLSNLLQLGDPRRRVLRSLNLALFTLAGLKKTKPQQREMSGKFGPDTNPDTSQSGRESLAVLVYTKPRVVTTSSATLWQDRIADS
jgi:hypothetical protein